MGYMIFLSHSSADARWVKWIAANAQQVGIQVYLYEHDPQPGRLVAEKVQVAIQSCDALIVLLTGNSQFSPYVQQEIGFARALKRPVVPLVQPGVDAASLAMLQGVEYISFDFHNPQQAMQTLLPYLQRLKQTKENQQAILLGFVTIVALAFLVSAGE